MPKIQFKPEGFDALKARYDDAVLFTWFAPADRPSLHPEHVFDFLNGIRLIISRESNQVDGSYDFVHISASFDPLTLSTHLQRPITADELLKLASETVKLIVPENSNIKYLGMMGGGIPHWIITEQPL